MKVRKSWWYHFKRSIDIYKKGGDRYIGKEANGNKYYERDLGGKLKRYQLNPKDLDIPAHPLWMAWLTYKRNDPPTDLEISRNLQNVELIKKRAEDIYERDLEKFPKFAEKLKQLNDKKIENDKKDDREFPIYKEYQ